MGAATLVSARLLRRDWRVLLAPMMYPNTGNMGLPVVLYAFGEAGFAFGITVMVTVSLFQFTLGTMMTSRGNPLKSLAKTPTVYAILIALALLSPVVFKLTRDYFDGKDVLPGEDLNK